MEGYLTDHAAAEGLPEADPEPVRSDYLAEREPFRQYADREDLPTGASSTAMYTGKIGSTRYFEKDLDEMDPHRAGSNIAASIALEYLPGDQPETIYDPEAGTVLMEEAGNRAVPHYRWAEGVAENMKASLFGLPDADEDSFYDAIATHVSLNNDDIGGNLLIDKYDSEPLTISPIDFDFAGKLEFSSFSLDSYERTARSKAQAFQLEFDEERFEDTLQRFAEETNTEAIQDSFQDIEDEINDPYVREQAEVYLDNIIDTIETLDDQFGY